jgi:hypothetical protein
MKLLKKGFSHIDLDNLELEWLSHPNKVELVSREIADAKLNLAELESEQEVVESRIKLKIRDNPEKYGLKSSANEPVKERMVLFKSYKRIIRKINEAKHIVNLLQGAMNTLEHRKKALEDLVTLQGRSYFATPRMEEDAPRRVKQKFEAADMKKSFTKKRKS